MVFVCALMVWKIMSCPRTMRSTKVHPHGVETWKSVCTCCLKFNAWDQPCLLCIIYNVVIIILRSYILVWEVVWTIFSIYSSCVPTWHFFSRAFLLNRAVSFLSLGRGRPRRLHGPCTFWFFFSVERHVCVWGRSPSRDFFVIFPQT
jgi:hypothetical protein